MRSAVVAFLIAVGCLVASSVVWLRATSTSTTTSGTNGISADPSSALNRFTNGELAQSALQADVNIASLYDGRLDLLDPRLALPQWHKHAREDAVRVHVAESQCPPPPLAVEMTDTLLAKAYEWHARSCTGGAIADEDRMVDEAPHMHPSGKSYAALAWARGGHSAAWIHDHLSSFHVLELAALDANALTIETRALRTLSMMSWEAIIRGDRVVLTPLSLIVAEHGPLGLARLYVYRRADWDAFSQRASMTLVPRNASALCANPASPALCWQPLTSAEHHRSLLIFATTLSAALTVIASLLVGILYVRERRRIHRDRVHVLRVLTHELRTPATSLRLDIEPLRAAYDELPASCQEPMLRISDGIERLLRVLHRSARYMALFETQGSGTDATSSGQLVKMCAIPSTRELFEELAEEWPDDVVLRADSPDGPLHTDPEWLGLAVKNLVENGARHGVSPLTVAWRIETRGREKELVVRVSDSGNTPEFSLRRAVMPFDRGEKSQGLGLGLAIVERVAELLHGRLSHEPSPTVFQLRLPNAQTHSDSGTA